MNVVKKPLRLARPRMTRKIKCFGGYTATFISGIIQKQRRGLAYFLLVYLSEPTPLFLYYAADEGGCSAAEAFGFSNHPWLVNSNSVIRRYDSDVYLGMSPIQNGGSYLMYWCVSVKVAKRWRTGTIQGHG